MSEELKALIDGYGQACRRDGSPAWESQEGVALAAYLASRPAADESAKPVYQFRYFGTGDWTDVSKDEFDSLSAAVMVKDTRFRVLYTEHAPVASKEAATLKDEEIAELRSALDASYKIITLLNHKIITCGVAARNPDSNLSRTGSYGGKWNSPQAEEVRKLRDERDALLGQRDASKAEPI